MRTLLVVILAAVVGLIGGMTAAFVEARSSGNEPISLEAPVADAESTVSARAPRVEVDEPTFDFGTMKRGTTKSHDFVFKNVGSAALTLRVGQTSCKCTLGTVADEPIMPGESVNVQLEWSAKQDSGPFRQSAMVLTNDPTQSQVQLMVTGTITDAKDISPPDFVFGKISAGESKTAEVFVMAMLQDELEVSSAELSDATTRDQFDIKIEPVDKAALPDPVARAGVKISLTAKPGLPVGRFNQWMVLRTDLADAKKLEIPVVGRVVGDISVYGSGWNEEQGVLTLGSVKSATGKSAKLNIVVRGEGAPEVKFGLASADPPEIKVSIGESKKLKDTLAHVPITIEIPPGTRPMVHLDTVQGNEGRVVLTTTHPELKELVLGVRFSVER